MRALGVALVGLAALATGVLAGGFLALALRTGSGAATYLAAHAAPAAALFAALAWGLARRNARRALAAAAALATAAYAFVFLGAAVTVSAAVLRSTSPFRILAFMALLPPWGASLLALLTTLLARSGTGFLTTASLVGSGAAFLAAVPPIAGALAGSGAPLVVGGVVLLLPASYGVAVLAAVLVRRRGA